MLGKLIRIKEAKKQIISDPIKVTVIGPVGGGKTHVIKKVCGTKQAVTNQDIVNIAFSPIVTLKEQMFQFGFIELEADEFFGKLVTELVAETKVLLMVFDFTSKNLKNLCQKWLDMIQQSSNSVPKKIVLFNKVSLKDEDR